MSESLWVHGAQVTTGGPHNDLIHYNYVPTHWLNIVGAWAPTAPMVPTRHGDGSDGWIYDPSGSHCEILPRIYDPSGSHGKIETRIYDPSESHDKIETRIYDPSGSRDKMVNN